MAALTEVTFSFEKAVGGGKNYECMNVSRVYHVMRPHAYT